MNTKNLDGFVIPDRIRFVTEPGGLTKALITTAASTAEVYLQGAHVAQFRKNGEPPLLFMSSKSYLEPGKPLRGGVPICFPWFGPREGQPGHGTVRLTPWELVETAASFDDGVKLSLRLPPGELTKVGWAEARVEFIITLGDTLAMELVVTNVTPADFTFEGALHTYFAVGDIAHTSVTGLNGIHYIDKTDRFARKLESGDEIRFSAPVDRVYLDSPGLAVIHDAQLRRKILVQKTGAASTVVWNPWADWSRATPDFGDEEYKQMVCVESGSVGENRITLKPGATARLKTVISSQAG
jgi:glucose-6-phosphate 1-epimerase